MIEPDYKIEDRVPFPGAPAFFRYHYNPHPLPAGHLSPVGQDGVTIFGFSHRSPYEEDRRKEDEAFRGRGAFPSACFSTLEPRGEYGFTPLAAVTEITEAEFRAAMAKGFEV